MNRIEQLRKTLLQKKNQHFLASEDEASLRYFVQNFGLQYVGASCRLVVAQFNSDRAYKICFRPILTNTQNVAEFERWQIIKNTRFAEYFMTVHSTEAGCILEVERVDGITLNAYYKTLPRDNKTQYNVIFTKLETVLSELKAEHGVELSDVTGENIVINPQTGNFKLVDYGL